MNKSILFIGIPQTILYSKSIKHSLESLGFTTYEPEFIKFKDQNAIEKRFFRKKFLTNFFNQQNKKYIEAAEKYKPDFIFVINNSRMSTLFLEYCNNNHIPIYLYCIDSIRWCDKALEHMHYYTDIFSYEPSDTKIEFSPNKFIKFIPLGYDKNIYQPLPQIKDKQEIDLCFVGNLDKRRLDILEQVAKYAYKNNKKFIVHTMLQLDKIPHFWLIPKILVRRLKFKIKYKYLCKCIINKGIIGNDLVELYNKSKICLNIHIGKHTGLHTGPNPRTFELLGCQAFEIIDAGHISETTLQHGKDLIEFHNTEELIKQIDYYLKVPEERLKIAAAGYNTAHNKYELSILMSKVIKYIK